MAERTGTTSRRLLALVLVLVLVAEGCSGAPSTSVTPAPASPAPESPAVAPDARIAFVSFRHGTDEIYVMNADGTGLERLIDGAYDPSSPAWSPDGTKIA